MTSWWGGTGLVAGRALTQILQSRSFKVVTGLLLVLSIAVVVVPRLLTGGPPTYTLATVGEADPAVAERDQMLDCLTHSAGAVEQHGRHVPHSAVEQDECRVAAELLELRLRKPRRADDHPVDLPSHRSREARARAAGSPPSPPGRQRDRPRVVRQARHRLPQCPADVATEAREGRGKAAVTLRLGSRRSAS